MLTFSELFFCHPKLGRYRPNDVCQLFVKALKPIHFRLPTRFIRSSGSRLRPEHELMPSSTIPSVGSVTVPYAACDLSEPCVVVKAKLDFDVPEEYEDSVFEAVECVVLRAVLDYDVPFCPEAERGRA